MEVLQPLETRCCSLKAVFDEMADLERRLLQELDKKFSLTTDVRSYESIIVRLKSGEVCKQTKALFFSWHLGELFRRINSAISVVSRSNRRSLFPSTFPKIHSPSKTRVMRL